MLGCIELRLRQGPGAQQPHSSISRGMVCGTPTSHSHSWLEARSDSTETWNPTGLSVKCGDVLRLVAYMDDLSLACSGTNSLGGSPNDGRERIPSGERATPLRTNQPKTPPEDQVPKGCSLHSMELLRDWFCKGADMTSAAEYEAALCQLEEDPPDIRQYNVEYRRRKVD